MKGLLNARQLGWQLSMSKSYRTLKEAVIARRNIQRDRTGAVVLPRLVVRKPKRGDVHPVPPTDLRLFLHLLPLEFLCGLKRIELRARQSIEVGRPFGCYLPDEKVVILFSLPTSFNFGWPSEDSLRRLLLFRPQVDFTDNGLEVAWTDLGQLAIWFFTDVVIHELAHHFDNQYGHKNRRIRGRRWQEAFAEVRANRFFSHLNSALKRRKAAAKSNAIMAKPV